MIVIAGRPPVSYRTFSVKQCRFGLCHDSMVQPIQSSTVSRPRAFRVWSAHPIEWLTLAVVAKIISGAIGLQHTDPVRASYVLPSVVGVVLLVLVSRRHAWAWWTFLLLNAIAFASFGILALVVAMSGTGNIVISWLGLGLSFIAVGAILAPGVRPQEAALACPAGLDPPPKTEL